MKANAWNAQFRAFGRRSGRGLTQNPDLLLSAFLAAQSLRLRRQPGFNGGAARKAAAKRSARGLRSAFLARKFPVAGLRRRIIQRPAALLYRPSTNHLRDRFNPNFLSKYVAMSARFKQKLAGRIDLTEFSFAKDPIETLNKLSAVVGLAGTKADIKLNFLDDCDDVTPYIVLAHLNKSMPPVISGGAITPDVREVIDAVGLRGALRMTSVNRNGRKRNRTQGYTVSAFKMTSRTPPGTFGDDDHQLRPQFKEYVADRFVDTINTWIGEHDLELTLEAEGSFTRAIGEALDNAERHGDAIDDHSEGEWSIAAFSKLMFVNGLPLLRCSVGIVSIGATISESLRSASDQVQTIIGRYVSRHSNHFTSDRRKDSLTTVMALQDGITRVAAASDADRGGVGFMELIDVFAELGDNGRDDLPSVFTIISGKTCVRVTTPFRQGARRSSARRELWFNDMNDPGEPPSKNHVMTLDHDFPGVILSACFTIDPTHLRKKFGDGDADA